MVVLRQLDGGGGGGGGNGDGGGGEDGGDAWWPTVEAVVEQVGCWSLAATTFQLLTNFLGPPT